MPLIVLQERLYQIDMSRGQQKKVILKIVNPDVQEFGIPDLSTTEGQNEIDANK